MPPITDRPAGLRQAYLERLIEHMLGTARGRHVAVALGMLVLFATMTNGVYSLATTLLTAPLGLPGWAADLLLVSVFFLLLGLALRAVKLAAGHLRFRVHCDEAAQPVRALCLFLSDLKADERDLVERLVASGEPLAPEQLDATRWRMPVEALAYHRPRLRQAVVIPSPESAAQMDLFVRLVRRLWPDEPPAVRSLWALGRDNPDVVPGWEAYRAGVAYHGDVTPLVRAADDAERALSAEGIPARDLVVDITSGTKLSGVAGVAIALNEGRRFQYVAGPPYRVFVYNPSYESAAAGEGG